MKYYGADTLQIGMVDLVGLAPRQTLIMGNDFRIVCCSVRCHTLVLLSTFLSLDL